jgi:DNA/RNA-binding domain of Phe-tRNA-synthetase-like protein
MCYTRSSTMSDEIIHVERAADCADVLLGIVHARGCTVEASLPELAHALEQAVVKAKEQSDEKLLALRGPVRKMLRFGHYKPTGRAKPASEYLLAVAREDRFPSIHNLVDINNLVSLESFLPISILDIDRAGTHRFVARRGRDGESYAFNDAGQVIDLVDLLLLARLPEDVPCANPVKDSMATKVTPQTTQALAVIYAPRDLESTLTSAVDRLTDVLQRWGGREVHVAANIV